MTAPSFRRVAAALVVGALSLAAPDPARSVPNAVVAVGALYVPGEVVVAAGTGLTFANLDAMSHDVTATESGPVGGLAFRSATIGRGTAPVVGVEDLEPNTYSFYCTVHTDMFGLLTVVG